MKKRKIRTMLMIMLITVFTTTSVFAINTANFKPYHNSKPITGAGKAKYEQSAPNGGSGYFSKWDSKTGSIIPATATAGKPGIDARYTDQAKRASGAYSARTKGTASGLSYYGTGERKPIHVLKTDKWYNFLTDKNSGNKVQVYYYHNKIYDPADTRADESGYVHFTTRTTVRAWNFSNSPKKRIRASQDGKVYATKAKMQANVPLRGNISLSNKARGGIPSVVVIGIDSADVIHEFFYETKSGSNWVTSGQRYNFHGTFTYGDIDDQQAISLSTGNLRGSTVLNNTNLRFKVDSGYAVYAAKTGPRSSVKEDTVALSVEGQTLYFVYSTASKSKTKSGAYYPDGSYAYYGTKAGGAAEPGVSTPIKRVSDSSKYNNVAETKVLENHLGAVNETFTYTITQHVPAGINPTDTTKRFIYSLFRFEDTLNPVLELVGTPKFTIGSTDVTGWFTNNSSGNNLKYTMTSAGLNSALTYGSGNGADVVMTFNVKVKNEYDYQALVDAGYQVGAWCKIPNNAKTVIRRSLTDAKKTESQLTHWTNTVNTLIPYIPPKPHDITVKKAIAGLDANPNHSFAYTAEFVGLERNKGYSYTKGSSTTSFTSDGQGNATVNFTLKGGESVKFNGIASKAKYNITEEGKENYTPSFEVTVGSDITKTDSKVGGNGESLSTKEETLPDSTAPIEYTFTNTYEVTKSLLIEKKVGGDMSKDKDFSFTINFNQDTLTINKDAEDGPTVNVTGGKYTFSLKDGEKLKLYNIPGGVSFNVTENISALECTQNYSVESGKGFITSAETEKWENDSLTTATFTAPMGNMDVKLLFTNSDTKNKNTKISKTVVGEETDEEFKFNTSITRLTPNTTYVALKSGGASYEIVMNEDGDLRLVSEEGMVKNIPVTITRPDGEKKVFVTNKNGVVENYIDWLKEGSPQTFEFQVTWLGKETKFRLANVVEDISETEAYAVFDSADSSLTFFRDEAGKYTNRQTDGTKTYYTGIETRQATSDAQIPWYSKRSNLQSVTFQDPINPISTAFWFYNCLYLTEVSGLEKLDTSDVTDMSSMFCYCRYLTALDVSHFDTSNVTSMQGMFYYCQNLTALDVSHFDTSNVTGMSSMFRNCQNLTTLDLSHFDTSNVTNMASMFFSCRNLTTLDVSHFDTSNVTSTGSMFRNCQNLTTTLNVMNMPSSYDSMCLSAATQSGAKITLKYITPVTSANVDTLVATKSSGSNVVNGGEGTFVPPTPPEPPLPVEHEYTQKFTYFAGDTTRTNVDLETFTSDDGGNASIDYTLKHGEEIYLLDLDEGSKYETTEAASKFIPSYKAGESQLTHHTNLVGEAYAVFDSADGSLTFFRDEAGKYTNGQTDGTKTYYTGVESTGTSTSTIPWYSQRGNVTNVTFEDAIKPAQTYYWFSDMTNLTSITGLEKLDTCNVTSMAGMFSGCQNLTSLDVSHFDTSNVTRMGSMFYGCQNLATLDVSHFDTSNVTSMYSMFSGCSNLTSLDVSHFNTSKVTNMEFMFYGCQNLATLDVSHFDTSKVTTMGYMFYDCQNLTSLDVSHFDTSKVTSMTWMFFNCRNLTTALNIMNMPSSYSNMCIYAATQNGAQITLKYIRPVTSANVNTLVATKSRTSNVVNGGQGTFTPPTPPTPPTRQLSEEGKRNRSLTTDKISTDENVAFTNLKSNIVDGKVSVTKQTTGNLANPEDEFDYVITIANAGTSPFYIRKGEGVEALSIETNKKGQVVVVNDKTGDATPAYEVTVTDKSGVQRQISSDSNGILPLTADDISITWEGGVIAISKENDENANYWDNTYDIEDNPLDNGTLLEDILDYDPSNPGWYEKVKITLSGDTLFKPGTKITPNAQGNATVNMKLKHNETFFIEDAPEGMTYQIKELGNSYTPSYDVLSGAEFVNVPSGTGTAGEDITTATETIPNDGTAAYIFTNNKFQRQNLKVEKELDGDATDPNDLFSFRVSVSGMNAGETLSDSKGDTLTADALGEISVVLDLKGGENYEIYNLPGGAYYEVTEYANKYKPRYEVFNAENPIDNPSEDAQAGFGMYNADLTCEGSLDSDSTVRFTNLKETTHYIEIEKRTQGELADDNDEFTFNLNFEGLKPNTTHTVYRLDGEDLGEVAGTFTSNANGNASGNINLKHGETIHISGLKDGAKYTITENPAGYTPSFETDLGKDSLKTKTKSGSKGENLSTGEEELTVDVSYLFTNTKGMDTPEKTVSDNDGITWDGEGEEIDVTENTVKNFATPWTYKIRQVVPEGVTDVLVRDEFPEQLTLSNIKVLVDGVDKTNEWTINTGDTEIIAYNETFTGNEFVLVFDVSVDTSKEQPLSNDGTHYRYVNSAFTMLDNIVLNSNTTLTKIPISGGITVSKNVKGSLGDVTKNFEYSAYFTGLKPNTEYSFHKPELRFLSVGLDGDNIVLYVTDKGDSPISKVKLIIQSPSGKEKAYVTGDDGKVNIPAEEGMYIVENGDGYIVFSYFNELSGDLNSELSSKDAGSTFTSNASGNATVNFSLHDDESMIFSAMPEGATYRITEFASDHVASFKLRASGDNPVIANASGGNLAKETALATATETINAGDGNVNIQFTNTRNMMTQTGTYAIFKFLLPALLILIALTLLYAFRRKIREGIGVLTR